MGIKITTSLAKMVRCLGDGDNNVIKFPIPDDSAGWQLAMGQIYDLAEDVSNNSEVVGYENNSLGEVFLILV